MNTLGMALVALQRDWRSGELRLIAIAILIAVASLTSVNFFTDRIRKATEIQATELLAADLVVRARDPIRQDIIAQARALGLETTLTTSFNSVAVAGDKMQMSEVKAVTDGYPIRGKLRTSDVLFGEEYVTDDIPAPGTVWVDARLLQTLAIKAGDALQLGATTFTVSRVLTYEPDRGGDLFNIAPRLLMNLTDLPATRLILPGSRVQYYLLVGGNADELGVFRNNMEQLSNEERLRIQGIRDARPELRRALERAEQFLGLAALVSIALAGLAVAMSAQRYATRHLDNCAIMRCLGAVQATITRLYVTQLLVLSVAGSLAGCLTGYLAQEILTAMMSDLTQYTIPSPSLRPVITGIAAGVITVLGFAMPQILRLRSVSPLRVLRRDLEPVPLSGFSTYVIAILALALLSPWQSGNIYLTLFTFIGILLTALMLTVCTRLVIVCLNRLRSRVGVAARYGMANIARRRQQSIAQVLGIGLGVMVMILLTLVRTDLLENWRNTIPEGTPNYFLINIQSDEVDDLGSFLEDNATLTSNIYPMIRARLTAINGAPVNPDEFNDPEGRRRAGREYNLTWASELQADNKLVAGTWWTGAPGGEAEFSLEDGIAADLQVQVHDALTFTIAGREISGKITSLRRVDWDTFNANFFVVANPGALEGYPGTWITSFYLTPDKRSLMLELVKRFPSVTVVDIDALITQVRTIMDRVIRAIEFVFIFTLLAGVVVLLAALQTTHDERSHESALMSALGANRKQILSSLVAEFLCLGLIAGVLAAFAATVVESILAKYVFRMDIIINPWVWLIAPVVCVMVIVIGGLAGTQKVLYTPPIVVLRRV
jgi:putative ABC transport system permease protein